jgi:hypothetical protein
MYEFIQTNANVLWILAVFSLITFFVSLAVVPFLLIRIPSDYFSHKTISPIKSVNALW